MPKQRSCSIGAAPRVVVLPLGVPHHILHVRRYDADMVPTSDLELEFGDRVGLLTSPEHKGDIRRFFGDTVKAAAEFSYVSLGISMVLGVLVGLIPVPIPGVGIVTLGLRREIYFGPDYREGIAAFLEKRPPKF